jgi:hypothetical protein
LEVASSDTDLIAAGRQGPKEGGVRDAIGQVAGPDGDVGAGPRFAETPDLDLDPGERGWRGHDGCADVAADVEHHRSGLAGLGEGFHG